ncbi:hypothetical protein PQC11_gp086 [Synechococcus phage S-H9-1]|uniref:Uncharacterized protein n=1 Tax=Synechococcus phage S-H9-1 TaxID=2783674 RepID=A0A873WH15_9CAUD|nr:hypothetical protein PQC11_gp086 [Synechococcus phage S-H9-1]QPB08242.1 hypothetical protein [Synechococcus phage S-H9-1]
MEGVVPLEAKKALGAPEARKQWCQCCDELGEMISQEVKTNPRYNRLQLFPGKDQPPR